jgi:peptidoglycan-associated lipoprotein
VLSNRAEEKESSMRSVRIVAVLPVLLAACSHAQRPPDPPASQFVTEPHLPPLPAPAPEPVLAQVAPPPEIAPASLYFELDAAELTVDARKVLQAFFDQAQQRPEEEIRIEGNCDERGTSEYNLALGQRRAEAAKNYLVDLGLDASRITTISNGKELPRATGDDEEAWKENRRDDLIAVSDEDPVSGAVSQASR